MSPGRCYRFTVLIFNVNSHIPTAYVLYITMNDCHATVGTRFTHYPLEMKFVSLWMKVYFQLNCNYAFNFFHLNIKQSFYALGLCDRISYTVTRPNFDSASFYGTEIYSFDLKQEIIRRLKIKLSNIKQLGF